MSDFLDRMAFRAQGAAPVLRPRPLSMYEGGPDLFEEVHEEREAPSPAPPAPSRAAWRSDAPEPEGRRAEAAPARIPGPWAEEATVPGRPSPASSRSRPVPDQAVENSIPTLAGEPATPASGVAAPAGAAAPPPVGAIPAAIVRRRAAESDGGRARLGGAMALPDSPAMARIDSDPERPGSETIRAAAPARSQAVTRRGDTSAGSVAAAPAPAPVADAPAPVQGVAAVELAPEPPAAGPRESGSRAVPTRTVPAAESPAPPAVATHSGVHPLAPRVEAAQAPAPVEIRIGRIDIHAAPAPAPPAPAAAPGPSLDAFLARPRR